MVIRLNNCTPLSKTQASCFGVGHTYTVCNQVPPTC